MTHGLTARVDQGLAAPTPAGTCPGTLAQLATVRVRHHGAFAYVTGDLADGTTLQLLRLRYNGSATTWGFAIYRASHDDYEDSILPSGYPFGTPQEALDCACGLYLNDITAWRQPPTN